MSVANEPQLPAFMNMSENEKWTLTLLVSAVSRLFLDLQREARVGFDFVLMYKTVLASFLEARSCCLFLECFAELFLWARKVSYSHQNKVILGWEMGQR